MDKEELYEEPVSEEDFDTKMRVLTMFLHHILFPAKFGIFIFAPVANEEGCLRRDIISNMEPEDLIEQLKTYISRKEH